MFRKVIFDDGRGMQLNRAQMWTLEPCMNVNSSTLTVFAMVLNSKWLAERRFNRFCFGCVELVSIRIHHYLLNHMFVMKCMSPLPNQALNLQKLEGSFDQDVLADRFVRWKDLFELDIESATFVSRLFA